VVGNEYNLVLFQAIRKMRLIPQPLVECEEIELYTLWWRLPSRYSEISASL
jgi:hypothetical protein